MTPEDPPRWFERPPPWWLLFAIFGVTGLSNGMIDVILRSQRIIWQRWYVLMECSAGLLLIGIVLRIYSARDAPVPSSIKLLVWTFLGAIGLVFWRWR